jgi:hypothetical protein
MNICVWNFIKANWPYLSTALALLIQGGRMLRKYIIVREAIKMKTPLLQEIVGKFLKDGVFVNETATAEIKHYIDSQGIVVVLPGDSSELIQSLTIYFNQVGKSYRIGLLKRMLNVALFISKNTIKERSFVELLNDGKLHLGNRHEFVFKKKDNLDLFENKQIYAYWKGGSLNATS